MAAAVMDNVISKFDSKEHDGRKTAEEMDEIRQKTLAYEYLCHLEEAKLWLEACLEESLPAAAELEENLRNGVYLAKLGHFISPKMLPLQKIYDINQLRYKNEGLQFRHTDNINKWLKVLKTTGLSDTFHPETTDIYDKKNMPRVIHCIHALSTILYKLGKAPLIEDLFGKAKFTDEEIDIMSKELQRYGIVMPAFKKIGGLLSVNIEEDFAFLHAAIININKAVETDEDLKSSLTNPAAKLHYILPHLLSTYQTVLQQAKKEKQLNMQNRSTDDNYIPDIYDELLTQVEIQQFISTINTTYSVDKVIEATLNDDKDTVLLELSSPWLQIKNIKPANKYFYLRGLKKAQNTSGLDSSNPIEVFQRIVNEANISAQNDTMIEDAVSHINKALNNNDRQELNKAFKALSSVIKHLSIDEYAMPLYYEELQLSKIDYGGELSCDDIINNVRVLSAIAQVSKSIDAGDSNQMWSALQCQLLELHGLNEESSLNYYCALRDAHRAKEQAGLPCTILTLLDIQDCIDAVNVQNDSTQSLIRDLQRLNTAVKNNDKEKLIYALSNEKFSFYKSIEKKEADLYLNLFKTYLKKSNSEELWLDDIQSIVTEAGIEVRDAKRTCDILVNVNFALVRNDFTEFMISMTEYNVNLPEKKLCQKKLFERFYDSFEKKKVNTCSPWVVHHTAAGRTVYIDIETGKHSWNTPKDFLPESQYLSIKEINTLLKDFNYEVKDIEIKCANYIMTILQARCRGYLARRRTAKLMYFKRNIKNIIKIQSWFRSLYVQKKYKSILEEKRKLREAQKNNPENRWKYFKSQEKKIIQIQALWRGKQARKAFLTLINAKDPSFNVVKHFVPLLDFSTDDYDKEMQLQTLRSEAVQLIRKNQGFSKQLDDMDIKIGLLIQNRITLQDVLAHRTKMNDLAKKSDSALHVDTLGHSEKTATAKNIFSTNTRGLRSLTKESKKLLDGYQQLFYVLQTNPFYLSKLMFCLPQSRANQFLQNVILSLYNFGANARDEYLLLKLFRYSLEEEIACKFNKPMDIITGNPIVLKMAVNHSRQMNGLTCLRNIVGPLVEKMLNDKNISIETSPIDIYKAWRNQMESRTGEASSLPQIVTQEQALSYEEVREKLNRGLATLKTMVKLFLERITECYDALPFSITYMARVLHHTLMKKFPCNPEKEVLKVVGHLIYYQFINAAIVAPDAFDIVTLPHDKCLSNDQRRNLASVAKILHFSASKKGFGDESAHLQCLNPFIIECHEKMKEFFKKCCHGPTLEEHFSMDEYSEATLLNKPYIYISVQEMCDTHSLLVEYEDIIAPDSSDRLHEILDELGRLEIGEEPPLAHLTNVMNSEVCLHLFDKNQPPVNDITDINQLFIKTKELCVSVLPFLNGDHLLQALCIGTTKEQQELYEAHVQQRLYSGMIKPNETMTLREHIAKLRKYLDKLEEEGYVSREDGYQSIVTAIALDLCNKGKYRRSQLRALQMMKKTKKALDDKSKFYQDQCNYYNQYINKCLENLNAGKKAIHGIDRKGSKETGKLNLKISVKYTAMKLYEKGILVEIDGLSVSQFKSVQFEIIPTDQNGIFKIKGKFMGVQMDEIELDIQHLLQLQYEGCSVMDLFGKAKVNVNLLLFLLNRKFYGKTK